VTLQGMCVWMAAVALHGRQQRRSWQRGDLGDLAVVHTTMMRPNSDGLARQQETSPKQEVAYAVLARSLEASSGAGRRCRAAGLGPDLGPLGLIWAGQALLIARF
jgi:hypothetical protein